MLTGIPPIAKPRTMHTSFAPAAYHEPNQLDSNPTDPTQPFPTNRVKDPYRS
jgi:hypothetical protein